MPRRTKWGVNYSFTPSLTSALDGLSDQSHGPADLPPGKSGTHSVGRWVSPRAGLDGRKNSRSHGDSIPGQSSP